MSDNENEKLPTSEELKSIDETLRHSRLGSISSKKLVDLVNVLENSQSSTMGSQKIIDLPDTKYVGDDLKKEEEDEKAKEEDEGGVIAAEEIIKSDQLKIDSIEASVEKISTKDIEELADKQEDLVSSTRSDNVKDENAVLDTLNATLDAVCEQCVIDDVKATLHRALDEINKNEKTDMKIENQEIVVHVGSTSDLQGLGIKIIPKVPDLKELLSPDITNEPVKVEPTLPEPEILEERPGTLPLPRWMPQPPLQPNCPFGLEFLSVVDTVRVSQTKMIPFFSEPSFIVSNHVGQYIYEVDVRTNCFSSFVCASKRSYEMSILNAGHIEVMHFTRPSTRHGRRSLEVYAPFDTLIGKINEGRGTMPYFIIVDSSSEVLFRVEAISGPPDSQLYTFGIMPTDGDSLVGKIKQETSGTLRRIFRENYMTINFYINLDAKIKALIMGCSFLIDLIFLEIF